MRIKVGDKWYDPEPGQPIMVVLSELDKQNLASMKSADDKYASFSDQDTMSQAEMLKWMNT